MRLAIVLALASSAWGAFPVGWTRRCPIVIPQGQVSGSPTMPVLISAANLPAEMKTTGDPNAAQANGGDIRFSIDSAGASQIALEIVVWTQNANPALASAELWVGPVAVNSASDVTIYVWYSAGGAVSQPAAGASFGSQAVWPSAYKMVWHLPSAASAADSTSNAVNGTNAGMISATGKIDGALSGDGTGGVQVNTANNPYASSVFSSNGLTLSVWVKPASLANAVGLVALLGMEGAYVLQAYADPGPTPGVFGFEIDGSGTDIKTTAAVTVGNWAHIVGTSDSSGNLKTYVNGVADVTGSQSFFDLDILTRPYTIAGHPVLTTINFNGVVDEARILNSPLSAAQIATEYNNLNSPSTFAIAGSPSTPSIKVARKVIQ